MELTPMNDSFAFFNFLSNRERLLTMRVTYLPSLLDIWTLTSIGAVDVDRIAAVDVCGGDRRKRGLREIVLHDGDVGCAVGGAGGKVSRRRHSDRRPLGSGFLGKLDCVAEKTNCHRCIKECATLVSYCSAAARFCEATH